MCAALKDGPFRLLAYMALVARDDDPRYWGGRDALAMALGMHPDEKEREPWYQKVKRHIRTLKTAGCIDVARAQAPGRNAEYLLTLSMKQGSQDDPSTGVTTRPLSDGPEPGNRGQNQPPTGVKNDRNRGHVSVSTGVTTRPPKEEEDKRGLKGGRTSPPRRLAPVRAGERARTGARTREDPPKSSFQPTLWPAPVPDPPGRCPDCKADHDGWTCAQYRNGDDLRKETDDGKANRAARRRRSAV